MNKKQYQQGIGKARKMERELSELLLELYDYSPEGTAQELMLERSLEPICEVGNLLRKLADYEANNQ